MTGSPSARERVERALSRIQDPSGEGARTFLATYRDSARDAAAAADQRALEGSKLGPLDGVIISIKDLFDVAGEPTRAGSTVLALASPAKSDAPVVKRLRQAGAVVIGKTNMSEFAFTGIGANPHYGTPANPADRARVPGGSSSGAGVAVADDMCEIAIGTDTGGSTRIPAALCGIVGFKPTKSRIPTEGAYPLSPTLDSVGPLARTVEECAAADAVLAGERPWNLEPAPLARLQLGILGGEPLTELDDTVGSRFEEAVAHLDCSGAQLSDAAIPALELMAEVNAIATIATAEAYHIHEHQLAAHGDEYDPFIRRRIEGGREVSDSSYEEMLRRRGELVGEMDASMLPFDALLLPTTPIVAPIKAELAREQAFSTANRLLLRNTSIANFFDLCAISLPIPGDRLPVGLMLFGRRGSDRKLLKIAASVEARLGSA